MNHTIESVRQKDFYEIVKVWEASVRATHHFIPEEYIQQIKPLLLNEYLNVVDLRCIRNASNQIIGFSGIADGKIEMLFIHPDWFGQGAGKSLVLYAVQHQNAEAVDVNEQNDLAVGFYQRMGFEVVSRSATDSLGKPYPLLHMKYKQN
jgi:putative acetyltransferase